LVEIAGEFVEGLLQFAHGERRHQVHLLDLAVGILAVGRHAEPHSADVFLVLGHEQILDLRAAPDDHDEQPGRERIERAAVPHFLDVEPAPHDRHDIVRSHAGRFVDQEDTIEILILHWVKVIAGAVGRVVHPSGKPA
jgi:hypothetical protein